jgi:hypothetical protein
MIKVVNIAGNSYMENYPIVSREEVKKMILYLLGTGFNDHSFEWNLDHSVSDILHYCGMWEEQKVMDAMMEGYKIASSDERIQICMNIMQYVEAM